MYVKTEPSGICERKGFVQIRLCMYLEPGDYGYDKHYVQVPVMPEGGYPGAVNDRGWALDMPAYKAWISNLPKVWQNNPFHNHFTLVEPTIDDNVIMDIGKAFLEEAYIKWATEQVLDLQNPPVHFHQPTSSTVMKAIDAKVKHLKESILEARI